MRPERLLPMIVVITGAAVFFSAYRNKTTIPTIPKEWRDQPAVVLFYKNECTTCHWLSKIPDARGTLGPGLDDVGNRALTIDPEHNGKDYLRESILQPSKVVREGFVNAMPSFEGKISQPDLEILVEWLASQRQEKKL